MRYIALCDSLSRQFAMILSLPYAQVLTQRIGKLAFDNDIKIFLSKDAFKKQELDANLVDNQNYISALTYLAASKICLVDYATSPTLVSNPITLHISDNLDHNQWCNIAGNRVQNTLVELAMNGTTVITSEQKWSNQEIVDLFRKIILQSTRHSKLVIAERGPTWNDAVFIDELVNARSAETRIYCLKSTATSNKAYINVKFRGSRAKAVKDPDHLHQRYLHISGIDIFPDYCLRYIRAECENWSLTMNLKECQLASKIALWEKQLNSIPL